MTRKDPNLTQRLLTVKTMFSIDPDDARPFATNTKVVYNHAYGMHYVTSAEPGACMPLPPDFVAPDGDADLAEAILAAQSRYLLHAHFEYNGAKYNALDEPKPTRTNLGLEIPTICEMHGISEPITLIFLPTQTQRSAMYPHSVYVRYGVPDDMEHGAYRGHVKRAVEAATFHLTRDAYLRRANSSVIAVPARLTFPTTLSARERLAASVLLNRCGEPMDA